MKRAATPDDFFDGLTQWRAEAEKLRAIMRACGLREALKWGRPVYMAAGKNVVGIVVFKSYFGLWFFEGASLEDKERVLVNAQEGKTKSMRQWRMTKAADIRPATIRSYVREAAAISAPSS
jgi:uncharacterized protein YdeI (YjbR/CyaY-like superfamily)